MKKPYLSLPFFFALFLVAGGLFAGVTVFATNEADIAYPVAELGDCRNEAECRAYCDDLEHIDECLAFAEQHNLLSDEEFEEARRFGQLGVDSGPGGCRGKNECEAYCEDVGNIQECVAFAEQHGILDDDDLQEAKRIAAALQQGAQLPGECRNKQECEAYCEDPSHMRECIEFGEAAGFIPPEELADAKKVLRAFEAGVALPGGCRGKNECEAYCQAPEHMEECVEFAIAAGFMSAEEAEDARKVMPLMLRGEMPGGCRSREECEAYCSDDSHIEECVAFFEQAGFMTPEEAEMFRRTGGKGPGDCRGREECEAYCNDPANQAACFEFAKQHGLIPEEELQGLEEGITRFKTGLEEAPPEVAQCLKDTIGQEVLAKIEAGTFLPNPGLGEKMRACFEEFLPPPGDFEHGGPGEFAPPPEAADCIQRIIGQTGGPPTPEQERQIREECFPQAGEHFEGGARPPEFEGEFPEEFQDQFEQEFQQQFQQQFEEEFQRQLEQQAPDGFQPPEDFQFEETHVEEAPAESSSVRQGFFGAVREAVMPALKRLLPFL